MIYNQLLSSNCFYFLVCACVCVCPDIVLWIFAELIISIYISIMSLKIKLFIHDVEEGKIVLLYFRQPCLSPILKPQALITSVVSNVVPLRALH